MRKNLNNECQNSELSLTAIMIGLILSFLLMSLMGCANSPCIKVEKEPIDCQNNIKYNRDMAECLAIYVEKY